MAATGRRWEEAVGGPERLKLEDIQMQRLSQAQIGKAGFIERREDIGPDYGMIAQLATQVGQAPTVSRKPRIPATGRAQPSLQEYMRGFSPAAGGQRVFEPVRVTPGTGRRREGPTPGTDVDMAPTERGQYGTYYGAAGAGAPEPYIEGKNYAYVLRKRTGEVMSQRAAYSRLQQLG